MEPSLLDKDRLPPEHDLEARIRVLEVKVSVQEQQNEDGFILLRTEMNAGFALLREEMARRFAEEALARAELESRLNTKIDQTAERLERKMDAQFRLLLRLYVSTLALVLGMAAKMFLF